MGSEIHWSQSGVEDEGLLLWWFDLILHNIYISKYKIGIYSTHLNSESGYEYHDNWFH